MRQVLISYYLAMYFQIEQYITVKNVTEVFCWLFYWYVQSIEEIVARYWWIGKTFMCSESQSIFEPETSRWDFWAATCLLIYMIDYWVGGEN